MPLLLGGVDAETITTIVVSIGTLVGGTIVGVRAGFKKIRGEAEDGAGSKIVGGTIMGSVEIAMLSERLREGSETQRENTSAVRELAHQIELLRVAGR